MQRLQGVSYLSFSSARSSVRSSSASTITSLRATCTHTQARSWDSYILALIANLKEAGQHFLHIKLHKKTTTKETTKNKTKRERQNTKSKTIKTNKYRKTTKTKNTKQEKKKSVQNKKVTNKQKDETNKQKPTQNPPPQKNLKQKQDNTKKWTQKRPKWAKTTKSKTTKIYLIRLQNTAPLFLCLCWTASICLLTL